MKWEGNRESDNVEDRRSSGGGMPVFGGRSIGIGTIVIALLGGWALGINPLTILSLLSGGGAPTAQVLQCPVGTVKSRIFHGLKTLREFMTVDCEVPEFPCEDVIYAV